MPQAINHLPQTFWTLNPGIIRTTLTRKQLQETLLATGGWITTHGRIFRIQSQHLGAGIYEVRLRERHE